MHSFYILPSFCINRRSIVVRTYPRALSSQLNSAAGKLNRIIPSLSSCWRAGEKLAVKPCSCLVTLSFPGTNKTSLTACASNFNLVKQILPQMGLFTYLRGAANLRNKSFEYAAKFRLMSTRWTSKWMAAIYFPASIAAPTAKLSAVPWDFIGLLHLCEDHTTAWIFDL